LVAGARERGLAVDARVVEGFRTQAGAGVSGTFEGRRVVAGSAAWLVSNGVDVAALATRADALAAGGASVVFVAVDARLAGLVALADEPAEGARATVETLRARGLRVVMASGDRSGTARAIAARVGVLADDVHGELVPEAKAQLVERLRSSGARVAMVGDGVNDAPALAAADVGIAMGHGTDVAAAAADVTLLRGGIAALPRALALARATLATIRRNLVWAFVYNVVGIPLAAGVFVPLTGWSLSPMFASAAMSLSSVSVLASSLWLRRFERESAPK
jgi:Cu+-exporting ATPase